MTDAQWADELARLAKLDRLAKRAAERFHETPRFQYVIDARNDEPPTGHAMRLAYAVLFAFALPLLAWVAALVIQWGGQI